MELLFVLALLIGAAVVLFHVIEFIVLLVAAAIVTISGPLERAANFATWHGGKILIGIVLVVAVVSAL